MILGKTGAERDRRLDKLELKLEATVRRLEDFSGQLGELELTSARMRELEVEWLDTYEKFRNLYARISKRVQREKASESEGPGGQPNGGVVNPAALALLQQGRTR
ncbi:MAG: hypothetical protein OEN00_16225 [Gemmatimonadota bacterium]|nr:hypothetical protein [Gemmatimonadota bacterium]